MDKVYQILHIKSWIKTMLTITHLEMNTAYKILQMKSENSIMLI